MAAPVHGREEYLRTRPLTLRDQSRPLWRTPREPRPIASYQAYKSAAAIFICPSDPNTGAVISENNYRYNFGGSTPYGGWVSSSNPQLSPDNGAFTIGKALRAKDFTDGLSKTAFFAERTKGSLKNAGVDKPTIDDVAGDYFKDLTMNVANDVTAMMNYAQSYNPVPSQFDFMAMGRWDRDQTQFPASYTNGWPIAGYTSTCYNHVAPRIGNSMTWAARAISSTRPGSMASCVPAANTAASAMSALATAT